MKYCFNELNEIENPNVQRQRRGKEKMKHKIKISRVENMESEIKRK